MFAWTHNGVTFGIAAALGFILAILPVNTISKGLSTTGKHGERPQPWISAEDLVEIILTTDIKLTLITLTFLVQVLNGCLIVKHEVNVEFKEKGHENTDHAVYQVG